MDAVRELWRELWGDLRRFVPSGVVLVLAAAAGIVALQLVAATLKAAHGIVLLAAQLAVGLGLALAAFGYYDNREALLRAGIVVAAVGVVAFLFGLWGALAE